MTIKLFKFIISRVFYYKNFIGLLRLIWRIENKYSIILILMKDQTISLNIKLKGQNIYFNNVGINRLGCLYEIYGKEIYKIKNKKNNVKVVLDLGSCCGYYILYAYYSYPKSIIYSFEPSTKNYQSLLENIAINNLNKNRLRTYRNVVSNKSEIIKLYLDNNEELNSINYKINTANNFENVPSITLEQIVKENQLTNIDIFKIDIEGAEYDIFEHLPTEIYCKIENIIGEFHEIENHNKESLVSFIKAKKFQLVDIDKTGSIYYFRKKD